MGQAIRETSSPVKMIVGLGNPGDRYANTRHNVGFWVIDRLAARLRIAVDEGMAHALVGRAHAEGEELLLVKPQTYMNDSGRAVRALLERFGLRPDEILIVYDDLALAPGTLRVRAKGSSGGHNGVKSVINYLGTEAFPRLRIGIGAVPEGVRGVDYVLGVPPKEEAALLQAAVEAACDAILTWVREGIERSMAQWNGVRLAPSQRVEAP